MRHVICWQRSFLSLNSTSLDPLPALLTLTTVPSPLDTRMLNVMDWTGGARQRFTPGNRNATVQKQMAHFAKVRASLQHTPGSERTFRPGFLHTTAGQRAPSRYKRHQYTGTASARPRRLAKIPREMFRPEQRRITQDRERSEGQEFAVHLGKRALSPSCGILSNTPGSQPRLTVSPLIQHATASDLNPKNRLPPLENDMAQEDKLLMENRRTLLGRTDWLGLAALRPVQMHFPSSRSKDRIGRRRRLQSFASRRGKPARQRLLTPLFDRRLDLQDHIMSRAIVRDDIQIKIGTDALSSQTQRSRHSRTPGKTSVRHPLTDFGPISEESMLLGEEGDAFEDWRSRSDDPHAAEADMPDAESLAVLAGSQTPFDVQQTPETPQMQMVSTAPKINPPRHTDQYHGMLEFTRDLADFVPNSEHFETLHASEGVGDSTRLAGELSKAKGGDMSQPKERSGPAPQADVVAAEIERYDKVWRDLMNITQQSSSHTSVAALKSSSLHITTSDNSNHHMLGITSGVSHESRPSVSTPKGAGTQASMLRHPDSAEVINETPRTTAHPHSPSASLRQIIDLAERPPPSAPNVEEDADDNVLWRQFIIGSQDSSEDPLQSHDHKPLPVQNHESSVAMNAQSSLFAISGLETSDKSTIGDSLFASASGPNGTSKTLSKSKLKKFTQSNQDYTETETSLPWRGEREGRESRRRRRRIVAAATRTGPQSSLPT